MSARERLGSRLGFILLSAGCAIGIGNVWRFPYVAGRSGGGWFVAIYLACLALIGLPVLIMEFAVGRASQRSIARLHEVLTPSRPIWRFHGVLGTLGLTLLMMFYTTVTAWMVIYFLKTLKGDFAFLDPAAVGVAFEAMLGDVKTLVITVAAVSLTGAAICALGLKGGLERVTKYMMLALLAIIVILAIHSLMLKGSRAGMRYYLVPNLDNLYKAGVGAVIVEAMNQAFFTLSLGIGAMAIFGSYIGRSRALAGEALNVVVLDTLVAIGAGLIVIPACFAFGVELTGGPKLVFVTLPNVFNQMRFGELWGAGFFLFMSFAAFTTVLAVFEGIIASVRDFTGLTRASACALLALVIPLLSLPCVFGFNFWSGFAPFGPGTCVLDLEDCLVSDIALPVGGLALVIYCAHRCGWGWWNFVAEADAGSGLRIGRGRFAAVFGFYCRWVLPLLIGGIFVLGIAKRFFHFEI